MFAQFNFGPSIGIDPGGTQFKIAQEFGYHFSGHGAGPALGASLEEAFGSGLGALPDRPKFWWDFQPVDGWACTSRPRRKIGYALFAASGGGARPHAFTSSSALRRTRAGETARSFMFRPFTIDMAAGDGFAAAYDLLFGAGSRSACHSALGPESWP